MRVERCRLISLILVDDALLGNCLRRRADTHCNGRASIALRGSFERTQSGGFRQGRVHGLEQLLQPGTKALLARSCCGGKCFRRRGRILRLSGPCLSDRCLPGLGGQYAGQAREHALRMAAGSDLELCCSGHAEDQSRCGAKAGLEGLEQCQGKQEFFPLLSNPDDLMVDFFSRLARTRSFICGPCVWVWELQSVRRPLPGPHAGAPLQELPGSCGSRTSCRGPAECGVPQPPLRGTPLPL